MKYSLEARIDQLFHYWKDRLPAEIVATSYDYTSYNHQSAAKSRRDALALEQAHRQALYEKEHGMEIIAEPGVECLECGFIGKRAEWPMTGTLACPKCNAKYTYQMRYALIYDEDCKGGD